MSTSESGCIAGCCLSSSICPLRECAEASEWSRVEELVFNEIDSCSNCVEFAVHKAVQDQQWDWVVRLSEKCSVQQRSEVVRQLCSHAVDRHQWDLVLQLVDMGVHSVLRNNILQSALDHRHVLCTAKLIDLGVSKRCRDRGIRQEIANGHCDFIVQLVNTVRDPDLTDFVLIESMKQNQWQLLSELVNEELSVTQMRSGVDCSQEQCPVSVSSLKQWCVDNGRANLTFFLALFTEDWELVVTVVNTHTSLDLDRRHCSMLMRGVELAAGKGDFSACAAMLKVCPLNVDSMNAAIYIKYPENKRLAKICEDQGLVDWALVLQPGNLAYIQGHRRHCQNPIVLDFILRTSATCRRWDITRELVAECTDLATLKHVLEGAVQNGQVDIAEVVICRVDPTTCDFFFDRTLLFLTVDSHRCPSEVKTKMVRLCIASGLSTFERDMEFLQNIYRRNQNCPTLTALNNHDLQIVRLMLVSGACSYKRLDEIRRNHEMQGRLNGNVDEKWKTGYRCILDAAATPSRLEHMARLVVSHTIGFRPGRSERIQGLPIPETVKGLVRFKDVLSTQDENCEEDEQM